MHENAGMFEKLSSVVEKTEELDESLKTSATDHLQSLKLSSNNISLRSRRNKMHLYEIHSLPLWL